MLHCFPLGFMPKLTILCSVKGFNYFHFAHIAKIYEYYEKYLVINAGHPQITILSLMHSDHMPAISDCKEFRVNMPNLMTHLKKVADQRPQATYYNVDMLKYQVFQEHISIL